MDSQWLPLVMAKACTAAGITGVTSLMICAKAVTRLAAAGCTDAEIATITGHSLRDVGAIWLRRGTSRDPGRDAAGIEEFKKLCRAGWRDHGEASREEACRRRARSGRLACHGNRHLPESLSLLPLPPKS